MTAAHPLAAILDAAADGRFPAVDGGVDVLPPDQHGTSAVVALTGHAYVLADVDPGEVAVRAPAGGYGASLDPGFLLWLAGGSRSVGLVDAVLVRRGTGGGRDGGHHATKEHEDHPRVRRAKQHRTEVAVYADDHGVAILGTGLVGRRELSVELFAPGAAPPGAGRGLIATGLARVRPEEWVWAQVSPGNARSLRAFLASGFRPIGSEVLLTPRP